MPVIPTRVFCDNVLSDCIPDAPLEHPSSSSFSSSSSMSSPTPSASSSSPVRFSTGPRALSYAGLIFVLVLIFLGCTLFLTCKRWKHRPELCCGPRSGREYGEDIEGPVRSPMRLRHDLPGSKSPLENPISPGHERNMTEKVLTPAPVGSEGEEGEGDDPQRERKTPITDEDHVQSGVQQTAKQKQKGKQKKRQSARGALPNIDVARRSWGAKRRSITPAIVIVRPDDDLEDGPSDQP